MNLRHLDKVLVGHLADRREILVLLGARQVGKTTILKRLFPEAQYLSLDVEPVRRALEKFDPAVYRQLLEPSARLLVLDELHLLSDPGRAAKIFYDLIPEVKLLVTGSSSFQVKNRASESLAGRKIDYYLYPLTLTEYLTQKGIRSGLDFPVLTPLTEKDDLKDDLLEEKYRLFDLAAVLENLLVYGLYPALIARPNDRLYLKNLVDSVIFRDLLDLSLLENRRAAENLLRLLAFQISSLVNYSELAAKLGIDVKTVRRYLSLFEQSFIIFTLPPFSRRKRLEVVKMPKVYFYDVGLRNALIDNFQPLALRPDAGALWENFAVAEVFKANYYGNFGYQLHFWRTALGSEVDLVLERQNELIGVEIKSARRRANTAFKNRYPQAKLVSVTKNNLL